MGVEKKARHESLRPHILLLNRSEDTASCIPHDIQPCDTTVRDHLAIHIFPLSDQVNGLLIAVGTRWEGVRLSNRFRA